jgi:hypothetical protein
MINIILELLSYYLTAVSKSFGEGNARGQAAYLYTHTACRSPGFNAGACA